MKKLHWYILSSFIGPLISTFVIVTVILIMQVIFVYIDDMVGKGLSVWIIMKLLIYVSASLIPTALPLSILLASIITFGNLGEHSELIAIKAAGISLAKAMQPIIIFMVILCYLTFLFSNYVIPYSNFRWKNLMYNIRVKKPTLSLTPGTFNTDVEGLSIKVEKKNGDTGEIEGVLIYQHKKYVGNVKCITAERGSMKFYEKSNQLVMTLINGYTYEEAQNNSGNKQQSTYEPFIKTSFKKQVVHFDVSSLNNIDLSQSKFNDNKTMLNIEQLSSRLESIRKEGIISQKRFSQQSVKDLYPDLTRTKDSIYLENKIIYNSNNLPSVYEMVSKQEKLSLIKQTQVQIESILRDLNNEGKSNRYYKKEIVGYILEIHRKYSLSFACIVLFFIGAPLGAIIRKGGFGFPVLFAISIFIIYQMIFMISQRVANSLSMDPILARWLPSLILLPFGLFLTRQATSESKILTLDSYTTFFYKIGFLLKKLWFKKQKHSS